VDSQTPFEPFDGREVIVMMSIVMQLNSAYRQFEEPGVIAAPRRRQRPVGPVAVSPEAMRAEDAELRRAIAHDPHLNVLVQCLDVPAPSAFGVLFDICPRAPHVCVLPGLLDLPASGKQPLLIGDVSTLTIQQQVALYDWQDQGHDDVQIISVTSTPLWPLVTSGRFMEGLFYRLNVMSIQAAAFA
jgi:hypothetical protein